MRRPSLDQLANIAVIIAATAVLLSYSRTLLVKAKSPTMARPPSYAAGDMLPAIDGVRPQMRDRTLVLFLSSHCSYCTKGMPFYRSLLERRTAGRVAVAVVSRDDLHTLQPYLASNQLAPDAVSSIGSHADVKLHVTPTVLLVDSTGSITRVWVGLLDAVRQAEVMTAAVVS